MATSRLFVDPKYLARGEDDKFAIAFARFASIPFAHLPSHDANTTVLGAELSATTSLMPDFSRRMDS
jgi:hypothetical protein